MEIKKYFGVLKNSNSLLVEKIEGDVDYKKYTHIVEIINHYGHNGNGDFIAKILTQGELREIKSGNWIVEPLVNCWFDWGRIGAKINVKDVNKKEHIFSISRDNRWPNRVEVFSNTTIKEIFEYIYILYKNIPILTIIFC